MGKSKIARNCWSKNHIFFIIIKNVKTKNNPFGGIWFVEGGEGNVRV